MPDQSFHATAPRLRRPWLSPTLPLSRLVTDLTCGCAVSLVMAIASASLVAQEPNAGDGAVNAPPAGIAGYEQRPYGSQPAVRSPDAPNGWLRRHVFTRRPTVAWKPDGTFGAEHGRHGSHSARCSGSCRARSHPMCSPRLNLRTALPGVASPFDPTQFRLPTLGLPPGLGTPEPTPEIKARVRAIRRA